MRATSRRRGRANVISHERSVALKSGRTGFILADFETGLDPVEDWTQEADRWEWSIEVETDDEVCF